MSLSAILAALVSMTSVADDMIYWGNEGEGSIRVANLADGSGAALLGGVIVGGAPCGVAIDVTGGASGRIYWADFTGDAIRAREIDGTGAITTLVTGEDGACGVAVDPAAEKIYWAAYESGLIRSANLDGSFPVTLVSGEAGPSGIAIDPAAGKIYWTNQLDGTVRVASLDGSALPTTLLSGQAHPLGVAVDVAANKIYWTNVWTFANPGWSGPGTIHRANLDGTGAEILVDEAATGGPAGVAGPVGIAIDPVDDKIYWANFGGGTIWSVTRSSGSNPTQLVGPGPGGIFANLPALLRSPQGTSAPLIAGEASVGADLTCGTGSWQPDLLGAYLFRAPHELAYQWQFDGSDIAGADASPFTPTAPGPYTCRVTATNHAGEASQTSATLAVRPTISVRKFYDANANGQLDATESFVTGWRFQVTGVGTYSTPTTVNLPPGTYEVRESNPVQTNWRPTTPKSVEVALGARDQKAVEFGNVCLAAGGAKSVGFWGNKNGQALIGADDLASMLALNLRDADGSSFEPASYNAFNNWLRKQNATNMAYALSAQLAVMQLNVLNGFVNDGGLIYAPGTNSANTLGFAAVNAVIDEANAELGSRGLTLGESPYRSYQSRLKDALSSANSNVSFVQSHSCTFSFS